MALCAPAAAPLPPQHSHGARAAPGPATRGWQSRTQTSRNSNRSWQRLPREGDAGSRARVQAGATDPGTLPWGPDATRKRRRLARVLKGEGESATAL